MNPSKDLRYEDAGVLSNTEFGLERLLVWIRKTEDHRAAAGTGRSVLKVGYFANVIDLGRGLGLALSTDGVGTKVLIAAMLGRYDTIGIDCVAMNVNDVLCVGAEPVSMLDYIGIEQATPEVLEAIGRGLYEGARQARINFVGGEISQISEIIKGARQGEGLDLIGMCVGLVPVDKVNEGQDVRPGDVIIGLASSGIHSNGLTLARKALFETAGLGPDDHVDELGRSVGEELLEPTRIYVDPVLELLEKKLPITALVHVTSDGFFNLTRVRAAVGFTIDRLPPPPPIFSLIQRLGNVSDAEMFRVYNMGIGFCLVMRDDPEARRTVGEVCRRIGLPAWEIGRVTDGPERTVQISEKRLVGHGDRFKQL